MQRRQSAAWLVHLYTALGGVIGVFALIAAAEGEIRRSFLLLIATLVIDSTDGIMARRAKVRVVLPHFDGAMVDNVIDVLTFVWVPVFIMWRADLLPHSLWLTLPVLAALYAYGQTEMKTADAFFLGFPSYWNVIALYLYWLRPSAPAAVLMIVIPAVLTFIPTRYLYASKNRILWKTTWTLGAIWLLTVVVMLSQRAPSPTLIWLSLFYPAYYMIASFTIDWRIRHRAWRNRRREQRSPRGSGAA